MAHLIRENAGKKTKWISELFTNKIFEFTFVSIFADMTIVQENLIDIQGSYGILDQYLWILATTKT